MTQSATQHKSTPARNKSRHPLSLHRTGRWYKKIHGKFYYFGTDRDSAIAAYHEQATRLHAGKGAIAFNANDLTLLTLCNLYLDHQESRLNSGEIGPQHYYDQRNRLRAFAKYMGSTRRVSEIVALDLQNYRAKLIGCGNKPNTINNHLAVIKAIFHWAEDNQVINASPKLRAVKKVRVAAKKQRDEKKAERKLSS